ncbi:MAG TPA: gliding motility lipoprotein GldB, partial [Salinimicrobium sp.]|nr:gliding motility lipoprotein GldB [Salinimicrobium sp.]
AKIPVEIEVRRFDQRFAGATADSLPILKKDFPLLFPKQTPDSVWVNKMTDTIQLELNKEVAAAFPNLEDLKSELKSFFQHVKYYFPKTEIPGVVTLTSNVDYRNSVLWGNGLLLIALDTYLGKDHHFYLGIQQYFRKNFEPEQILPDVSVEFAETLLKRPTSRVFLDHMIYYGKILYLKDILIPFKTDAQKIGYTREELKWAQANEEQIWRYLVEKELLFASNPDLYRRFLLPGPFTKFYLRLDHESPDRLGRYMAWQIVRQYMKNTDVGVAEMLKTDAKKIFDKSNYKPRK